jgi:two-component sensor histidine kinase
MIHTQPTSSSVPSSSLSGDDLLLRETYHRSSNDLQLVISLLSLQSRRAAHPEAREALADAMARVAVLAHARSDLHHQRPADLERALQHVCEALLSQTEPRSILISLHFEYECQGFSPQSVAALALVVNELATNAIKHAFHEGTAGHIRISVRRGGDRHATITVEDDGTPFPAADGRQKRGMGLSLVRRLVESVDGLFIQHEAAPKCFEVRVPLQSASERA